MRKDRLKTVWRALTLLSATFYPTLALRYTITDDEIPYSARNFPKWDDGEKRKPNNVPNSIMCVGEGE